MKTFANVMKVIAALAAIAGIVYVVVNYGDKIAAWFKETFGCCCCDCDCCDCGEEDAPAMDAPVEEAAVVAEDADFQG